jgi:hypothetical protein
MVAVIQSGATLTVTTQTNTTNSFSAGALRADMLSNPKIDSPTISRWFDTSAFAQPAAYQFGNEGVGILRADGRNAFNFSVLRNFQITEHKKFQFRAELFNAFNHPKFGNPGIVLGAAGFGIVNSAVAARTVQLGLRMAF